MIQSLNIKNFQSHKETTLDFHPGVNVILGATDSGKTSIIRSLRWLIWNRPGGDDFRSDWGGETSVEIITDNQSIRRSKDKENLYEIGAVKSQDYKELKAFGTKVPEEIQQLLNIDDTNLQKQFDSPFLISATPGEVAAYFNQIAHLERIDSSVSYANSRILKLNSTLTTNKEDIKTWQEELEQYRYIDKFEIDLEELEHQVSSQTQRISSQNRLRIHLEGMAENDVAIKKQERITENEEAVDRLLVLHGEREAAQEELVVLQLVMGTILKKKVEEDQLLKKVELLPQVETLLKLHKERDALWSDSRNLRNAIREIQGMKAKQIAVELTLEVKEKQFIKHMPDECPLCGFNSAGL